MTRKLFYLKTLLLLSCFSFGLKAQQQSIRLKDGTRLAAEASIVDQNAPAVLLLHQCNRDQSMWQPLVQKLKEQGYNTLTVDMRGYGKSKSAAFNIDTQDYDKVTKHFKNDIDDVNAFWRSLLPQSSSRIVIGASCGGALASKTAAMYQDVEAMVLLSPSLRDHWISPEFKTQLYARKQLPVLAIASQGDNNARNAIEKVFQSNAAKNTQMHLYKGRLHGEPLFTHDPHLPQYIVDWIERVLD